MENFLIGSQLMIIGMGTVFIFLTIMILAMNISEKIIGFINKYYPEEKEADKKTNIKKSKILNDEEIALAIAVAIHSKEMGKC